MHEGPRGGGVLPPVLAEAVSVHRVAPIAPGRTTRGEDREAVEAVRHRLRSSRRNAAESEPGRPDGEHPPSTRPTGRAVWDSRLRTAWVEALGQSAIPDWTGMVERQRGVLI